ncbi:MAG: hypothetical protein RL131_913 [Bacteroidota bacterium]
MLVPQFNFLINSFFLSQLGPGYLGASGITGVYYLIFSAIGFGINNGLQSLISRRGGQEREKEIGELFMQSIYITLAVAALGILLTYTLAPYVFTEFTTQSLKEISIDFLFVRIWGLPFLYLYQMRNALLVGTNQSNLLIWGTLAETVANVVLDYTLIFGHWGFPKMGFVGAAYASVCAEFLGMIVVFAIIHSKGMSERFNMFGKWRINIPLCKTILTQSSPLIVQYGISIISWEFFFILVSHDGPMALDISQVMRLLFGFFGTLIWAFAATSNTMVSNIIGQGKQKHVMDLVKKIALLSFVSTFVLFIPFQLFPKQILSLFDSNSEFLVMAIPVLRIVTVAILVMSVSSVCLNAVTGTGNTRINLFIEFFTIILYCIYIYFTMEKFDLPITWGWGSEWLYWTCILIMSLFYLKSGKWDNERSRNV